MATYTVRIKEVSTGYAEFTTKEEAEEFLQEIDYDLVRWTECETTETIITPNG